MKQTIWSGAGQNSAKLEIVFADVNLSFYSDQLKSSINPINIGVFRFNENIGGGRSAPPGISDLD